jgi:hypothetical protein
MAAADVNELLVRGRSTDLARFARADVDVVETFAGNPHPKRRGARNGALWSLILVVPATLAAAGLLLDRLWRRRARRVARRRGADGGGLPEVNRPG